MANQAAGAGLVITDHQLVDFAGLMQTATLIPAS